jgi:hypothetical protein
MPVLIIGFAVAAPDAANPLAKGRYTQVPLCLSRWSLISTSRLRWE